MKVGIFCIQPDAAADPAVVASHAEGLGFASYWVPDHIILPVTSETTDAIRRELDTLAADIFGSASV